MWAILYGHRRFVVLVGATQQAAEKLLADIKSELLWNSRLLQDFPSCCYPIKCLEGNAKRQVGQVAWGLPTQIIWAADRLVFPTIDREDSSCSGACITACGLTGNLRGQCHSLNTGEIIRPNMIILDDPQTRESAASPSQTQRRLEILMGDLLGLAGPTDTISCAAPMTVIYKDDLADTLLDRTKYPQWKGERAKLLYKFPANEKLWDEYHQILMEDLRAGDDTGTNATKFYKKNRKAMDEGALVGWDARYTANEISAIQYAMNLFYRDSNAFAAEYQNDPMAAASQEVETIDAKGVCGRINRRKRYVVPQGAVHLTAYIDCSMGVLWYAIIAFAPDFTASIIDYGTYPEQNKAYFTLPQAKNTLQRMFPTAGLAGQLYTGLTNLTDKIASREYQDETGTAYHVSRMFVDSGYETTTIYQFCKESKYRNILFPAKGVGIGVKSKPFAEYKKFKGDFNGFHIRSPRPNKGNPKVMHIDTNFWKSFVMECLNKSPADPQALTIFGDEKTNHQMFAEQMTAEVCIAVSAEGRCVNEWKEKANRDNHWFDCVVGCFAAAALLGCQILTPKKAIPTDKQQPKPMKPKVSYMSW